MAIVSDGMVWVAKAIGNDTASATALMDFIAIGTDNTAAATAQSALIAQDQIAAATGTNVSTKWGINDTLQLVKDAFTFAGSKTIYEFGVFNAASGGQMLCRSVGGGVAVTADDELKVTVKIEVKQGA